MARKQTWAAKLAVAAAGAALALATLPIGAVAMEMPSFGDGSGFSFGGGANVFSFDYTGDHTGTVMADGVEDSREDSEIKNEIADENAALAKNGGTLTLTNVDITKSGEVSNENYSLFYGVNAAVLSTGEGTLVVMDGGSIDATGTGANAVVATDNGIAYVTNADIHTNATSAHGIDSTYAGTIIADGLNIHTEDQRSAAVATDRGGGTVSLSNSTVESDGFNSPILYSTGDIQFINVTGTSTGSRIAVIDNMNTFMAYKSDLTTSLDESNGNAFNIYKSTSGDAETMTGERATLQLIQSKITTDITSGTVISVRGNDADIFLGNSEFVHDAESISLIDVAAAKGMMGGNASPSTANMTLAQETVAGDMICDTASTLVVWITDASEWTGTANIVDPSVDGVSASEAPITINVDETSTWVVTADAVVSNLNVADGGQIVDENGNTVSIIVNGTTEVEGDSDITVTVMDAYSTDFDDEGMVEIANDRLVDRADFDEEMGLETAYTMELTEEEPVEEPAEEPADVEEPTEEPAEEPADVEEPTEEPAEEPATEPAATTDNNVPYVIAGIAAAAIVAGVAIHFRKKNEA